MDDLTANQIVFTILIIIVLMIFFALNTIGQSFMPTKFLKNNAGNYSGFKIVMVFLAIGAIGAILYWAFKPKITTRASATRLKEE
jgi:magnesium-transporting ATPase (P-type)